MYIYYTPYYLVKHQDVPDIERFLNFFKMYGLLAMPVDRTNVIKFPVQVKSLFPLPKMRVFTKTYAEICDERAQDILKQAEKLGTCIYVLWSGGIDSTLILCCLLKNASPSQKDRIVVFLSEESIVEYPMFYAKYIRGQLHCKSSYSYSTVLGTKNLILNGENNDQLFGADGIATIINLFDYETIHKPYDRQVCTKFFAERMGEHTALWVNLIERLVEKAPVSLKTNFDVFWWINFALKWQVVFLRPLSFTPKDNAHLFSQEYIDDYYTSFFNTEDFQLWSMNNLDLRIKGEWRTYKWPAKDVIYEFTKDEEYRDNKLKRGSLAYILTRRFPFQFIDEKFQFHMEAELDDFHNKDNDFI